MVWIAAVILGLLWAGALANGYTAGGYIHLLPAAALVLIGYGLDRHRRNRCAVAS